MLSKLTGAVNLSPHQQRQSAWNKFALEQSSKHLVSGGEVAVALQRPGSRPRTAPGRRFSTRARSPLPWLSQTVQAQHDAPEGRKDDHKQTDRHSRAACSWYHWAAMNCVHGWSSYRAVTGTTAFLIFARCHRSSPKRQHATSQLNLLNNSCRASRAAARFSSCLAGATAQANKAKMTEVGLVISSSTPSELAAMVRTGKFSGTL